MIYQHNDTFGVAKFYIQTKHGIYYNGSKEELIETIDNINAFGEETLDANDIQEYSLTPDQQTRFDEVSVIPGVTLDDVSGYTLAGTLGASIAYRLYAQQREVIGQGQMLTDLELASIETGQVMTDLELALYAQKGGTDDV